jgi:hypothetical protein
MARDIARRLDSLKARRTGTGDRLDRMLMTARDDALGISRRLIEESYQKRAAASQPYTRYALGSMQEVGPDYTRVSMETAERVWDRLEVELTALGRDVGFRLQGSVPCNIHIKGVSDVDLLALDEAFHTYDREGSRARSGHYNSPVGCTAISALQSLRGQVEHTLRSKYPAAKVDVSGGKAVKISGGSLARAVDVVPSHWHDTTDYQRTAQEHDRGVFIFDKKAGTRVHNMPFRHIKLIDTQDTLALLGLKKSIRLCKNVKADAEEDGTEISLPSFEITATMYHADLAALRLGVSYELAILGETQRHLDALACNFDQARKLLVPDGSRRIFDTDAMLHGLRRLSIEIDDLLKEVAKEQDYRLAVAGDPRLADSRQVVAKAYIPLA